VVTNVRLKWGHSKATEKWGHKYSDCSLRNLDLKKRRMKRLWDNRTRNLLKTAEE
jgi:hypothetical protein